MTSGAEAQQPLTSSRNIFGGQNYSNGSVSTPNVFGGFNTTSRSGGFSSSTPNAFGGSNFSNGGFTTPIGGGGFNYVAPRGGGITTFKPNIFGGFKLAIALAVIGAVIGEYVAAEKGLGYLRLQANSQFDTTLNFATVVTISLVGVLLYYVIALIESKVSFQRESAK